MGFRWAIGFGFGLGIEMHVTCVSNMSQHLRLHDRLAVVHGDDLLEITGSVGCALSLSNYLVRVRARVRGRGRGGWGIG